MLERSLLLLTARALEQDDDELATQAIVALRELPEDVTELRRMRRASGRVARRTLIGRAHRALVVRERENADQLDLLGSSCLMLARVAPSLTPSERHVLEPSVRDLSEVLSALARELGDSETRQGAADRALEVANTASGVDAPRVPRWWSRSPACGWSRPTSWSSPASILDDAVQALREGIVEQRVAGAGETKAAAKGVLAAVTEELG